ncbi:MAG: 1-deoxy-D-xylulose-5-phosphate reductoisomerase, partial [Clostridia bacterium]|nr:1-deoxy-D-xylulose-5-phosphate reductoisomerase [Clostridia bacterium]
MKNVVILGSTGSIGTQSLEVIEEKEGFSVLAISGNSNIELLEKQARKFKPKFVAVPDEKKANELKLQLKDVNTVVLSGKESLEEIAALPEADTAITGIVGIAGLLPTLSAVKAGKRIGLANKETLVTAGDIVMSTAKKTGAEIIPVDSEHSAIFQCMAARVNDKNYDSELKRIILTASGGPFFGKSKDELKNITKKEALKHPNWTMGAKITIDSATLMNKGLEVLEAKSLFSVPLSKVDVLVHRQSIVHSMVEFSDNAVIAQLGAPDMKLPIQYALTYPARLSMSDNSLDLTKSALTFERADADTFKCLKLAYKAGDTGGTMP